MKSVSTSPIIIMALCFCFFFPLAVGGRCSKTVVGVNNGIDGSAIRSSLANTKVGDGPRSQGILGGGWDQVHNGDTRSAG